MQSVTGPSVRSAIDAQLKEAYEQRARNLGWSVQITEQILQQCLADSYPEGIAKAKNQLALFYMIQGEFTKANEFAHDALSYFEQTNDTKGIADAHYTIGGIYYRTNKYPQGLVELSLCLGAYRQLEDWANQARTLKSMGTIYEYFNDWNKAIESYEKSIEASRKVADESTESNALNPLSSIYYKQGKRDQAFETIERSVALKIKTQDKRGLAFALYGRGKLFLKEQVPDRALKDLLEVVELQKNAGDQLGLGMAYNKLGAAYHQLQQLEDASRYYLLALELGNRYKVQIITFRANYNLYRLAKQQGDHVRALEYLEAYLEQRENLFSHENFNLIKSYEAILKIEALEREAQAEKDLNKVIGKKNAELDSFFYRVSHDLKGPIASLIGLNQVVQNEISEPIAKSYFEMYHHQIQRMNNIVMSLIDITRMKHIEVKREVIDFEKLIGECIRSYEHAPHFKEIEFDINIQEDLKFASEWVILNTILQNLIENAIKYSRRSVQSVVRVRVYRQADALLIEVEDNGQGIPAAHQEKIFDMFHRANDHAQGSGLGLYILKRAVERLHGDIHLASEVQHGSKFTVTLPY